VVAASRDHESVSKVLEKRLELARQGVGRFKILGIVFVVVTASSDEANLKLLQGRRLTYSGCSCSPYRGW